MCEFVMMEGLNAPRWRGCKCYAKITACNNREIVLFFFFSLRLKATFAFHRQHLHQLTSCNFLRD